MRKSHFPFPCRLYRGEYELGAMSAAKYKAVQNLDVSCVVCQRSAAFQDAFMMPGRLSWYGVDCSQQLAF